MGRRQLLPVDIGTSDDDPKLVIDRIIGGANHQPISRDARQWRGEGLDSLSHSQCALEVTPHVPILHVIQAWSEVSQTPKSTEQHTFLSRFFILTSAITQCSPCRVSPRNVKPIFFRMNPVSCGRRVSLKPDRSARSTNLVRHPSQRHNRLSKSHLRCSHPPSSSSIDM